MASRKRGTTATCACPHTMTIIRSARRLSEENCRICLENFFDTPTGRDRITPVKMGCEHLFCQECIEMHLSSAIKCPLPWCKAQLPLQSDACDLCAYWERTHASSLVVTIRPAEMADSLKVALDQLALEDEFFDIPRKCRNRFLAHVRSTLARFKWQFHSGVDLAELLDPFLMTIHAEEARSYYGANLSFPAPNPSLFPARKHDTEDYPAGKEPWVAAFLRQWALDYEDMNGEVREGWGVSSRKDTDHEWSWEWPYKKILAHKSENGKSMYLVKWVGERFNSSWVEGEHLGHDERKVYDGAHDPDKWEGEDTPRKKRRIS